MRRLPRGARWLLRLMAVPREDRPAIEADLQELFEERRRERGAAYAHRRLYRDIASLRTSRPVVTLGRASRPRASFLSDAWIDLRYAARLFGRQPAVLLLTVAGLSLGLGIATAAFSVMNAATLRGEGLADPDRAPGVLKITGTGLSTSWDYEEFAHLRRGAQSMQVEAVVPADVQVAATAGDVDAPATGIAFVSGGFFAATGARMATGRALAAVDEHASAAGPPPAVVSFAFWTSRLASDPGVVGRIIRIGRTDAAIIGVAAPGYGVPGNRRLWLPLTAYGPVYGSAQGRGTPDTGLEVFVRLPAEASLVEAEAELGAVASSLPPTRGADSRTGVRLDRDAAPGRAGAADALSITLLVFAAIGLVLLLACANVATVLVSTAIAREREMGVRGAVGASRGRIVRQLVTESLALGVVSAALGLLLTAWALPVIGTMIEAPAGTDLAPDATVYLFLGIVTLLTAVGAGLAPAWHGRGADLVTPLKGGEGGHGRLAPRRLRSMLVMTQAAASVLLIVFATLFVRATVRASAIDVGFDASGLYAVSPGLGDPFSSDGSAITRFWTRAMPELRGIPGIASVSLADPSPFGGTTKTSLARGEPARIVNLIGTDADYFRTVGLRTLAGRTYSREEVAAGEPVAVVSESLARAYWPDRSPLGELLPPDIPLPGARPVVVGVVSDAVTSQLHEARPFAIYEPLDPASEKFAQLLVRAAPGATGAIDQASQRLRAMDPQANVTIAGVAARIEDEAIRPRVLAVLTAVVGAVAIVLCVVGLYGLTASLVGQRSREMAVRAAIGAEPGDLLRLLMWDSLKPVVIGLGAGIAAAVLAGRVVAATTFFGVPAGDPIALAGAAAILLAAATVAVLMPTRRAASVDAALVLRRS